MQLKYCRLFIMAALVFATDLPCLSQTKKPDNLSIPFGQHTILVPAPEGLQEVSGKFEALTATFKASEPQQNVLLAGYVSDSDFQNLQRGAPPLMHTYAKVSTLKAWREVHLSLSVFTEVVADFRKNTEQYTNPNGPIAKKVIENVEQQLSQNSSVATNLEVGQPKKLAEFNVSSYVYSVVLISAVKAEAGGKDLKRLVLAAASLVYVKNRILFVNSYRTYESEADLETIKNSVNRWTSSILAANESK